MTDETEDTDELPYDFIKHLEDLPDGPKKDQLIKNEYRMTNRCFYSSDRVEFTQEIRNQMRCDPQAASLSICQGLGYCTEPLEKQEELYNDESEDEGERTDEQGAPKCHWCVTVWNDDKRSSLDILKDVVERRTKGRH